MFYFRADFSYGYGFKESARFLRFSSRLRFSSLFSRFQQYLHRSLRLGHTFVCLKRLHRFKHRCNDVAVPKRNYAFFRKSFVSVHHYFAAAGLLLITLHPIGIAILAFNPMILLPNFNSLFLFLFYGGSIALLAVDIAFGAALLRKKFNSHWRTFHALMYVALFFGVIHANLAGLDLQKVYLMAIYDILFAGVLLAFGLKRLQLYRIKARKNGMVNLAK